MVFKTIIDDFIERINHVEWFSQIGKAHNWDKTQFKFAKSLSEAQQYWTSELFEEANSVAWESFRQIIVKENELGQIWENSYYKCKDTLVESLGESEKALDLIKSVSQEIDEFAIQLPFIGAIGELIISHLNYQYDYYSTQIPLLISGNWVCGWEGNLSEDQFIYPSKTFIVY